MHTQHVTPTVGETVHLPLHQFAWTQDHLSEEVLQKLQLEYDELGTKALEQLQAIQLKTGRQDLFDTLRENHSTNEVLASFWAETQTIPKWVDWDQIARGQRFFYKHMAANFVGFALQGFMGENTTTASTAEVLVRTGGFSTRVLLRRLLETFQWLLQVTKDIEAIKPGGEGHIATVRVRLLHATVRHRIIKLTESKAGYFDVQKHGIPINTADSMHSIATFGCNPIWLQLPRLGIKPTAQEAEDYMALFRHAWNQSMILHPSEKSKILGHNFIECLKDVPPLNLSRSFIEAGTRVINGEAHGDLIDISKPGLLSYCQFYGLCFVLRGMTIMQRLSPRFEDYLAATSRSWIYITIIESRSHKFGLGGASNFSLKWEPKAGNTTTGKEDAARPAAAGKVMVRPVEAFSMAVFLMVALAGLSFVMTVMLAFWYTFLRW